MFKKFSLVVLILLGSFILDGCRNSSEPHDDIKRDVTGEDPKLKKLIDETKALLNSDAPSTTESDFNKTMFGQSSVTKEEARKSERAHLLVASAKDPDPEWFATKVDTPVIVAKSGQSYTVHLSKLRRDGSIIGRVDNDKLRFVVRIQRDKDDFEYVTDASKYVTWVAQGELSVTVPNDLDKGRLIVGVRPNFTDVATEAIAERWSTVITAEIWKVKPDVITLDKSTVLFPIDDATILSNESKFTKDDISIKVKTTLDSQKLITLPLVVKNSLKVGDLVSYTYKNNPYGGKVHKVEQKGDQQLILLTPEYPKVYEITDIDPNAIKDQGLYPEHIVYREGNAIKSDTNESDPTKFSKNAKEDRGFNKRYGSWEINCSMGDTAITFEHTFSLSPFDVGIDMTALATSSKTECTVSPAKDGKFQIFKLPPLAGGPASILTSFLGTEIKIDPYGAFKVSVDGLPKIGIKTGYTYKKKGFFNFISPTQFAYLGSRDLEKADPYKAGVEFAVLAGYEMKLNAISSDGFLGGIYSFLTLGKKEISDVGISVKIGPEISFVSEALNAKEVYNSDKSSSMALSGNITGSISVSPTIDNILKYFGILSISEIKYPKWPLKEIKIKELEFTYSKLTDDGQGHASLNNFSLKSANTKKLISDSRGVLSIKDTSSSVFNDKTESINYDMSECESTGYNINTPAIGCVGWMCGKVDKPVKLCKGKLTVSPVVAVARVDKVASAKATINYKSSNATVNISGSLLQPEVSSIDMIKDSTQKITFSKECKEAGSKRGKISVSAQGTPFKDESEATLVCYDDDLKGDPHMVTADKLGYDFFASGDYIISRIKDVDDYEVQARFLPGFKTSWPQAVALKVGGDTVEIQGVGTDGHGDGSGVHISALAIWINGKKYYERGVHSSYQSKHNIKSKIIPLPSGGMIAITQSISSNVLTFPATLAVIWPKGSPAENYGVVVSAAKGSNSFMQIQIARPDKFAGREEGLMGNNNGNPDDDFTRRNGQQLGKDTPMSFTALYALFGADWLVRHNESLFRNPEAIKPKFPDSVTTLTPEQRALGESACRELTGYYREACIMDVGLTGSADLVKEYYANSKDLNELSKKIKKPNKDDTRYSMTTTQKALQADSGYLLHYKQDINITKDVGDGNFMLMLRPPRGSTASLSNGELSFSGSGDISTDLEVDCTQLNSSTDLDHLQSEGSLQLWIQDSFSGTLDHKVSEVALSCVDESKRAVYTLQLGKRDEFADSNDTNQHYTRDVRVKHTSGEKSEYIVELTPPKGATLKFANGSEANITAVGELNSSIELNCVNLSDTNSSNKGSIKLWEIDPLFKRAGRVLAQTTLSCKKSRVLKTGQTKSYTKYDDGYYQKGEDRSYSRDDVNEIVTDNATGLIWQDNAEAKTVTKNWNDAKEYCQNLTLSGFDDWRLPSRKELVSLSDYGRVNPAIDPSFKNVVSDYYWSSTTYAGNAGNAWIVYFGYGSQDYSGKSDGGYVRCVRAGQ